MGQSLTKTSEFNKLYKLLNTLPKYQTLLIKQAHNKRIVKFQMVEEN